MTGKWLYRQFCASEKTLPIFFQDWWLDAVCGEGNWDAAIAMKGGEAVAVMPYYVMRKYGFKLLHMPPLTATLGPWIRKVDTKYQKQMGYQKEIMTSLIEQLPAFDSFKQSWHYDVTNWLPFYWKGFHQTTNYTYVIEDTFDTERVWGNFKSELRTSIKQARNRLHVDTLNHGGLEDIIWLNRAIFYRQDMKVPFDENILRRLDRVCLERNCRIIFLIRDEKGHLMAGVFIIWDNTSAYYLVGGKNPTYKGNAGVALLIWEAIRYLSQFARCFNFEGSMKDSIEFFFRSFGGRQKQIFNIYKYNSYLINTYSDLSSFFRLRSLWAHRRV